MPSPSPGKHRGPVVRQLSLQNQSQSGQRGLKKQFSEDDGRVLEAVGVTAQGWATGSERPVPILRIGSGEGKIGQNKVTGRPKPVKVAWADRKTDNIESPSGVEVIATKCQGQPRPTSVKPQRLRSPLLGNKDTLVYTRLQLEERLRNAWSERAKIKPNINIFLGHGSETNGPATDRPARDAAAVPDTASALSDTSAPLDKKRKSMQVRALFHDFCPPEYEAKPREGCFVPDAEENCEEDGKSSLGSEEKAEGAGRHLQELNKIEIRMTKAEDKGEAASLEESPLGVKRCRNKENLRSKPLVADSTPEEKTVTAQDRRANFRRSSALHKTITESFSDQKEEKEKTEEPKPPQRKPPLVRAFSAPSQNDVSDPQKAANLQKKVKIATQRRLQPTISFDLPSSNAEDAAALRERIKSAPVRRRLKSAAARRKNKDKDSSDEEKETKEPAASTKKPTRRTRTKNGGDIVTMVSLVSPAESDTEDSVINLPMEPWTGEEKEETPQNSSGVAEDPKDGSQFLVQKFVSLRKTTKSVTFHPHPILNRGYSASFPSRRAPAGTPLIIPTPVVSNPALTPAQLLERDKRPSLFSGLTSGADGRGIKRRFLRSSSESPKEDYEDPEEKPPQILEKSEEAEDKANGKPELRCPKEKECWNLYQKMVEKGVNVSFDTVLRGMLTPTEYRLRKNRLLSNC